MGEQLDLETQGLSEVDCLLHLVHETQKRLLGLEIGELVEGLLELNWTVGAESTLWRR